MYEEIDLTPYIKRILKRWHWIAFGTVGFLVLSTLFAFLSTPVYMATAVVSLKEDLNVVQLDSRIRESDETYAPASYVDLVQSSYMLEQVFQQIDPPVEGIASLDDLQDVVEVLPNRSYSLLFLRVKLPNVDDAARIANIWADVFVMTTDTLFTNEAQLTVFEAQLAQAETHLNEVEADILQFESQNQFEVISQTLSVYTQLQVDSVLDGQQNSVLLQDIEQFREQVNVDQLTDPLLIQVTILQFYQTIYGIETELQLQLSPLEIGELVDKPAQLSSLDSLIQIIESKNLRAEADAITREERILDLNAQVAELRQQRESLQRDYKIAVEFYEAIANQVTEERLVNNDINQRAYFVSPAVPVENLVSWRKSYVVISGVIAGFLISLFMTLFVSWWQENRHLLSHSEL